MLIHNSEIHTPYLQTWRKIVNNVRTKEHYHTWHDSKESALEFIGAYFQSLGRKAPTEYLITEGDPVRTANSMNEPYGKFIKNGNVLIISPLHN